MWSVPLNEPAQTDTNKMLFSSIMWLSHQNFLDGCPFKLTRMDRADFYCCLFPVTCGTFSGWNKCEQFNRELYGVIYDVLRSDTWRRHGQWVSACFCVYVRADGGSGHTCPDREAIETPRSGQPHPNPHLLSLVHKRPNMTFDPSGFHSDWMSGPAVNNAQWSARRWGGEGVSLPLVPPSTQTGKSSGVTISEEQTRRLFFPSGHGDEMIRPLKTEKIEAKESEKEEE